MNRRPLVMAILALGAVQFSLADSATDSATTRPASQSADSPTSDPDLQRIDSLAAKVQSLSAHFEQEKFTPLLKKPLQSSGTVRAAGDVIRWDTEKPQPSVLYSDGHEIRLYYPDQKLEEIYPIDPKMSGLLASPLPRLSALRQYFSVQRADAIAFGDLADRIAKSSPIIIRLIPTDDFLKHHVQEVAVAIDRGTAMALAMQTIDADGDKTVMFFSDCKPNAGIAPKDLDLNVPPDTTISHPATGNAPG